MEGYISQILIWAPSFSPKGWMFCHGQTLPIAQNQALFALIGTTYGGNGTTHFALPDLRSKTPICAGNTVQLGKNVGANTVTLTPAQLPAHTHTWSAFSEGGIATLSAIPAGNLVANTTNPNGGVDNDYASTGTIVAFGEKSIAPAGGGQPVSVVQPSLGVNYIICIQGLFPPQN